MFIIHLIKIGRNVRFSIFGIYFFDKNVAPSQQELLRCMAYGGLEKIICRIVVQSREILIYDPECISSRKEKKYPKYQLVYLYTLGDFT